MDLNFSSEKQRAEVVGTRETIYTTDRTVGDAFLQLINGVEIENLSNFCRELKKVLEEEEHRDFSNEEIYELTQNVNLPQELKKKLLEIAYICVDSGKHLGEKEIPGTNINTSSWISHSLFEGRLCRQFAEKAGLNPEIAQKLGILHDYGRKYTHTFEHTIRGYEELQKIGWHEEAYSCLTHSFIANASGKASRCNNCDSAEKGFYVDDNGDPQWKEEPDNKETKKDDIALFLDQYRYNDYDNLLTVADLMATDRGIVSPLDRVNDIATRKPIDPKNRSCFIAHYINRLNILMFELGWIDGELPKEIKATPNVTLEDLMEKFEEISNIFYEKYQNRNQEQNKRKTTINMNEVIINALSDPELNQDTINSVPNHEKSTTLELS